LKRNTSSKYFSCCTATHAHFLKLAGDGAKPMCGECISFVLPGEEIARPRRVVPPVPPVPPDPPEAPTPAPAPQPPRYGTHSSP